MNGTTTGIPSTIIGILGTTFGITSTIIGILGNPSDAVAHTTHRARCAAAPDQTKWPAGLSFRKGVERVLKAGD